MINIGYKYFYIYTNNSAEAEKWFKTQKLVFHNSMTFEQSHTNRILDATLNLINEHGTSTKWNFRTAFCMNYISLEIYICSWSTKIVQFLAYTFLRWFQITINNYPVRQQLSRLVVVFFFSFILLVLFICLFCRSIAYFRMCAVVLFTPRALGLSNKQFCPAYVLLSFLKILLWRCSRSHKQHTRHTVHRMPHEICACLTDVLFFFGVCLFLSLLLLLLPSLWGKKKYLFLMNYTVEISIDYDFSFSLSICHNCSLTRVSFSYFIMPIFN